MTAEHFGLLMERQVAAAEQKHPLRFWAVAWRFKELSRKNLQKNLK